MQVSQSLTLAFFVLLVPSVLLLALVRSHTLNLYWVSPQFRTFLLVSSGVLSWLISYWLHEDIRVTMHPAVGTLSVGFAFLGLLFVAGAWLKESSDLAWFGVFSAEWPLVFSVVVVLFFVSQRARRFCRELLKTRPAAFWIAGLVVFLAALLVSLRFKNLQLVEGTTMSARAGVPSLVMIVFLLSFTFQLYLKRRLGVVLSFALALFLLGLTITSRMLHSPWHLVWWYSHNLYFASLFLSAYGILEGNRARERDQLIAELGALSEKLEDQSLRDPLTRCFNRRYIEDALENELRKVVRSSLPLALLIVDADYFKLVNDTYGHPLGDAVLVELADRMRSVMRKSDILARYGGEEFFVLLPQTNRIGGQELAAKMLNAVRSQPFQEKTAALRVTISIGVADTLSPGVTGSLSLVEAADRALYTAKRSGRDRAVTLEPLTFQIPSDEP